MITGNWTCDVFKKSLLDGTFKPDSLKLALYTKQATLNSQTEAYTTEGEVQDIGYTPGGKPLDVEVRLDGSVAFLIINNVQWSGQITARAGVIYQESQGAVCVLDFGSDIKSSTKFVVEFPPATPDSALLRIA